MKKLIFLTAILLLSFTGFATHNMAGDISYKHVSGYTYQFTVRTFTNTFNTQADRCEITLFVLPDSFLIPRINGLSVLCPATHDGEMICTNVKYNIYQGNYTFTGPGTYSFGMQDMNMSAGICDVPNSVNTSFNLLGEMVINPIFGDNDSPEYSGAALMLNNVGIISTYNPAVINNQADSLYFDFDLSSPVGITLPPASTSLTINHQTGVITWDAPTMVCNYIFNVTMKEYRNVSGTYYYMGTTMQEIYTDNTCSSDLLVHENNGEDNAITISPNPFTSQTTITSTKYEVQSIKITDVVGNEIRNYELGIRNEKSVTIDMSSIAKGIYFLKIEDEKKNVINRKIVIQ